MAADGGIGTPDRLLFEGPEWDFEKLRRVYDAIEEIALDELGLDVYPNQIEVITSEQMLDAYSSIGMPLIYQHWSFGKHFARDEALYRAGMQGLAYEIVINSNPCICLHHGGEHDDDAGAGDRACRLRPQPLLQEQLPVPPVDRRRRHPRLPRLRHATTSPHARSATAVEAVERLLDAAHALMNHGVHRYRRPRQARSRGGAQAPGRAPAA